MTNPAPALSGVARRRLAENLRVIRRWSQDELAEAVGLDRSYIGGIERAECNVGLDTLEKIANATGVPIGRNSTKRSIGGNTLGYASL